jgi:DamX protein
MSQDIGPQAPEAQSFMSSDSMDFSENSEDLIDPFSKNSSTAFFGGADRRVLLDEVVHLCQFGNNLVAVLGEDGVGRTTFLSQAKYDLAETAFCCFVSGSLTLSADDIFTQIIAQLELPVATSSSAGEMLAKLRHAMSEGYLHRVVIIVDNAHLLDDQILSALLSLLQGHQGNHLHILMSGDQPLAQRLDHFEMVDVLVYDIVLNPLNLGEVREYINFKLNAAGYQNADYLSDAQVSSIWSQSKGYPKVINEVAQSVLFEQEIGEDEDGAKQSGLPLLHMSLLVFLLAALIMALFYMGGDDAVDESLKLAESAPAIELEKQLPETGAQTENANPLNQSEEASLSANNSGDIAQGSMESAGVMPTGVGSAATAEKKDVSSITPSDISNKSTQGEQVSTQQKPALASTSPIQASVQPQVNNVSPEAAVKKTESLPASQTIEKSSVNANEKVVTTAVVNSSPSLREELKKEVEALNSSQSQALKPLTKEEQIVMSWPGDHYTLQVIAASQRQGLEQFISQQPNNDQLQLVTVNRNNKPWYVIVTGVYPSPVQARANIQKLPQAQVNTGPWSRKISEIKQEIEAFRGK